MTESLDVLIIPISLAIVELAKQMGWLPRDNAKAILLTNLVVMAVLYGAVQFISFRPDLGPYVKSIFDILVYALAASGLYSSSKALTR